MKKAVTLLLFVAPFLATAQNSITLEDLWQKYAYMPRSVDGLNSMNDGLHYTVLEENTVNKYSYKTGALVETFRFDPGTGSRATTINVDNYSFSNDESKMLLATESEGIYRYSSRENNLVYDVSTKTTTPLSTTGKQMYATFSPSGNKVAYVINNNLYFKNLADGREMQITRDGETNKIINGGSDWVYEEEFAIVRAFEWSPDGNRIAYLRFDETNVPMFGMAMFRGQLYPKDYEFKYPKVGEKNSVVTAHIYDLTTGTSTEVRFPSAYEYIPRIKWNEASGNLVVFTMNRLQNELKLFEIGREGKATLLLEEKAPAYLEIHDNLTFLKDGSFIWTSEKSGYMHIYLHAKDGKEIRQLTSGDWDVTKFHGVDNAGKVMFYESAEVSPMERHIYSVQVDGKNKKKLTSRPGVNDAKFSKSFAYFLCMNSDAGVPPHISLLDQAGKEVRVLEENKELKQKLDGLSLTKPEFFTFKTADGTSLNGYTIKPKNFDAAKKYPVFMYVYGGPGSQQVMKQWGSLNYIWFQMLAQQGYIIACVDNRGTGGRGREFRTCTYKQLGKLETDDQIEAAKYLGSLPYVEKSRIGIFGWSYGGYMTSLCITRGADVFKTAIAVAPVTNWKFYDSIYTERYMGTRESNPNGYDANAPIAFADRLKGNYLLVHGTADDNVHWQNSAELVNALVKSNRQFHQFIYPDRNHGIYGGNTRLHLYKMMTDFIAGNL